jgi:hypothetical protein
MRFSGKVTKRRWAAGSKSEHEAVCLETDDKVFKLRRAGGNPFHDEQLEQLVGMHVELEGKALDASTVLVTSWKTHE